MYICCPTYLFSSHMNEEINLHGSPDSILINKQIKVPPNLNATIAKFDYVPPELICSYITNK